MDNRFKRIFGDRKPVIAMVHFDALPGAPLYDPAGGIEAIVAHARRDLLALQAAGVDAVMFGNENDRPYVFTAPPEGVAAMTAIVQANAPALNRRRSGPT